MKAEHEEKQQRKRCETFKLGTDENDCKGENYFMRK
jgi:hypothetical protein